MLDSGHGQMLEDRVILDAEPACVELTPVVASSGRSPKPRLTRPDSSFVTHLIATALRMPQTRQLRRASPADALTAYGADQSRSSGIGCRTRQTI